MRSDVVELRKNVKNIIVDASSTAVAIQAAEPSSDAAEALLYAESAISYRLKWRVLGSYHYIGGFLQAAD